MKKAHGEKGAKTKIISVLAATILSFLLAACSGGSPNGGSGGTTYTLTIQGVNSTTTPSGSVSVNAGVSTTISASATSPWVWPATGGLTVVSGAATIANPDSLSTT